METELVMLEKMEANGDWLEQNYEEVSKEFLNEFVAIRDAEIVAHSKRLDVLLENLKSRSIDLSDILVEFISGRDFKVIL